MFNSQFIPAPRFHPLVPWDFLEPTFRRGMVSCFPETTRACRGFLQLATRCTTHVRSTFKTWLFLRVTSEATSTDPGRADGGTSKGHPRTHSGHGGGPSHLSHWTCPDFSRTEGEVQEEAIAKAQAFHKVSSKGGGDSAEIGGLYWHYMFLRPR